MLMADSAKFWFWYITVQNRKNIPNVRNNTKLYCFKKATNMLRLATLIDSWETKEVDINSLFFWIVD